MQNTLDGLTVKVNPDGNISILIHHDDLIKALSNTTKATNGCTHALAVKRHIPHKTNGFTHFAPVVTITRAEAV